MVDPDFDEMPGEGGFVVMNPSGSWPFLTAAMQPS
jgi:hypothetical protein